MRAERNGLYNRHDLSPKLVMLQGSATRDSYREAFHIAPARGLDL